MAPEDLVAVVAGVGGVVTLVLLVILVARVMAGRRIVPRARATDPIAAAKSYVLALIARRPGYAVAALAPTARNRVVQPPLVHPVVTTPGPYRVGTPDEMRAFARSFVAPGGGLMRWAAVKRIGLVGSAGDVARVEIEMTLQSMPTWAYTVSIVLLVIARIIGLIVGGILYFTMRKRAVHRTVVTLLRGRDGAWYLLDPELPDARALPAF